MAKGKSIRSIATVVKKFTTGGVDYKPGERFPKHELAVPLTMDTARGMVGAQLIVLDRIPGPGDKLGEGTRNPNAPRRDVAATFPE